MYNLKFLIAAVSCLGQALAAPTPTTNSINRSFNKRASLEDSAFGYASLNGGTTGGAGGATTTVSSYAEFTAAVEGDDPKIVIVSGPIEKTADQVDVGSNTSIIGKDATAVLTGFGLRLKRVENVIIRNLGISKVLADSGDAIGAEYSNNIWIDHVDVSSDRDHDKDYYDGLLDFKRGSDYITVSNTFIHDHWKASLVGHSNSNEDEDKGHLHVTYANNYWFNINSRGPSVRFGTAHIYNNYFLSVSDGINTRIGAQVLVEGNTWVDGKKALYSTDEGYAVERNNDFGGAKNEAEEGTLTSVDYDYDLIEASAVEGAVVGTAGQTLVF
ncbi:pectate lyase family protein [Aspergillus mulundensis]|uniref:pectate lyase n=1 Tax=Aspergillus mulundensis TaxID=1810919 RepID=A0A3D8RK62_9EURO|nr:Pectate lyase A [Aspergillus mulundensis]RDW74435.1 Pectate lyase A [Aspergillus mulundensis]